MSDQVKKILQMVADGPEGQIEPTFAAKVAVVAQQDIVTAAEIKSLLDQSAFSGLSSDFVMAVLNSAWNMALSQDK